MPTIATEIPGGLTGRLLWLGLIHSGWIALAIAGTVSFLFQAAPRWNHRTRHGWLAAAMLAAALGPIVVAIAHPVVESRIVLRPTADATSVVITRADRPEAAVREPSGSIDGRAATGPSPATSPFTPISHLIARAAIGLRAARPALSAAWALIATTLGLILAIGALGVRRLCRQAEPGPTAMQHRCHRLARRLRLRTPPSVLVHPTQAEPFLCGLFRPAIVLPRSWVDGASPRGVDAILAHELAHAGRRDHLVNVAQRLIEAALFFHPAVHWLSRSLRREREACADALAVRLTGDPMALAEALQSVARLRLESRPLPAARTSLGGPPGSLLPRIQELIGMTPPRPRWSAWSLLAWPAAGFLALLAASAGLADEPTQSPQAPASTTDGRPPSTTSSGRDPIRGPISPDAWSTRFPEKLTPDDDRQISLEVKTFAGDPAGWRAILDRLEPFHKEAEVAAWTLDDDSLRELVIRAQRDPGGNVHWAPKVTTFNGAQATILNRARRKYIAGYDRPSDPAQHFRPIRKEWAEGFRVAIVPRIRPGAMNLSIQAENSQLTDLRTMWIQRRVGPELIAAEYQVPTVADRRCQLDCNLPESRHLLISLGTIQQPRKAQGPAAWANAVLTAIDLRPIPAGTQPVEFLVAITPRQIILEGEEHTPAVRNESHPKGEPRPE